MQKPAAKQTREPTKNGPRAVPLTFQGQVDKWFLPVVFVAIGAVIVWTFVHASLAK